MTGQKPANPDVYNVPLSQWELPYSDGTAYIIDKAMSYDVNDRYDDMKMMLKDVSSIYRHTAAFRLYILGMVLSSVIYLAAMSFGIWCIVHGSSLKLGEEYHKINKRFIRYYDSGDYAKTIDTGYDLISDSRYRKILNHNKKDKIEVLHILGECYFQNEDYIDALEYYKEAARLITNVREYSDYYRDYIVALIRCGYIDEAQNELEKVKEEGIEAVDIQLLNAEMLIYNNNYAEALSAIEELKAENLNAKTKIHILILGSEAAGAIKDYNRQIIYLEEAYNLDNTISILRKLGSAYMLIVNKEKMTQGQVDMYTKKALQCYEELAQKSYSSLNDSINLAICYRALEKYEKSIRILKNLEGENTDYRISMNLAFAYDKNGEIDRAGNYVKKAITQYHNTPENERESEGSDNIQSLLALSRKYE